jgi:hypothetical protein
VKHPITQKANTLKLKRKTATPETPVAVEEETVTPSTTTKKTRSNKNAPVKQEPKYFIPGLERPDVTPKKYPGVLKSRKTVNRPEFIITLDEASFRYVWEMLEARAHKDHQQYNAIPSIDSATRNSIDSFRRSYAHAMGIDVPKTKKLVKAVAK